RQIVWDTITLRNEDGEASGLAAIGRDLTEQRELEARLLQAEKLESIGRLAAGVAHDFKNLLTLIMGISAVLQKMDRKLPAYKVLADAQSAAQQCAALTEQLLAIGRRQHLRPERINLNELIASEEALLRSMIGQGIEFVQDLDPSLGFVYA